MADAELFWQKKNDLEELRLKRKHEQYIKGGNFAPLVSTAWSCLYLNLIISINRISGLDRKLRVTIIALQVTC